MLSHKESIVELLQSPSPHMDFDLKKFVYPSEFKSWTLSTVRIRISSCMKNTFLMLTACLLANSRPSLGRVCFLAFFVLSNAPLMAMTSHERDEKIMYICRVFGALKLNTFEIGAPVKKNLQGLYIHRYLLLMAPTTDVELQNDYDYLIMWLKSQLEICQNHQANLLINHLVQQGQDIDQCFRKSMAPPKDTYDNINLTSEH